jgi:hypothetical protein
MLPPEGFAALRPVVTELEKLGVRYYIGGSVASSKFGYARMTQDIDLVANLLPQHVHSFVDTMQKDYYVNKQTVSDAVARRSCFNLIHYSSIFKIDIFASKNRDYDRQAMDRCRKQPLIKDDPTTIFSVAAVEDVILAKCEWYRLGDEASTQQWNDILKVLEVQQNHVDRDYLQKWAVELHVADLLERAWKEIKEKDISDDNIRNT